MGVLACPGYEDSPAWSYAFSFGHHKGESGSPQVFGSHVPSPRLHERELLAWKTFPERRVQLRPDEGDTNWGDRQDDPFALGNIVKAI